MSRFDFLVNGGGSVTVTFQRLPFAQRDVTVIVPWNRIVTMETVVLAVNNVTVATTPVAAGGCSTVAHDYRTMRPTVLATWQHTQLGACPSRSTVIAESQVLTITG